MFTLRNAMDLAKGAQGLGNMDPKTLQYKSAVLGDYVLTDAQALVEAERMKSGKHATDNGMGVDYLGNEGGKLPGHPSFSSESPYHVKGLQAAEGGDWVQADGKWLYYPSQKQFDRDPNYNAKLQEYYRKEKGKGIDGIVMPPKLK